MIDGKLDMRNHLLQFVPLIGYLTLPAALPILLAIFFRFFCHSGLVKLRPSSIDFVQLAEELFLFRSPSIRLHRAVVNDSLHCSEQKT
jgi:hypothetical protein